MIVEGHKDVVSSSEALLTNDELIENGSILKGYDTIEDLNEDKEAHIDEINNDILEMINEYYDNMIEIPTEMEEQSEPNNIISFNRKYSDLDDVYRYTIYRRDNFECWYCKLPMNLTIDHIYPLASGGNNNPRNLITCCLRCNSKKGTTISDYNNIIDLHERNKYANIEADIDEADFEAHFDKIYAERKRTGHNYS